jgi:phytoene dehydrogenase-like protein
MTTAAIVGSGPNGLSAAITLAQAGIDVTLFEARETVGGAARTGESTLPGFRHDLGSSVYPMAVASPFFQSLPLERYGLRWIEADAPLAHPLDDGTAVMLEHDLEATAAGFGERGHNPDTAAYNRIVRPIVDAWPTLRSELLAPIMHLPQHPIQMARFGLRAMFPATTLAKLAFSSTRARALFAGNAAHSVLPLERWFSSAVGLVLSAAGHTTGWPIAEGGAQSISNSLARYLISLGGKIETGREITSLEELAGYDLILCDTSPRQLSRLARESLTGKYRQAIENYKYGPGAFKVDWALSQPIPWTAKDCLRAATVHLGGTLEEIAASERAPWSGSVSDSPFVLLTQPSLFDPTRAPEGKHTAWAYCHVPNGFVGDLTARIEAQVERFAPGFRDCILARRATSPAQFESWNPNLIGGDLSGGAMNLNQLLSRPTDWQYRTSSRKIYLCSASTPPGGGVHGMCGHLAAKAALKDLGVSKG